MPGLSEKLAVQAELNKDWDYTSPSVIKIFNMTKKQGSFGFATCQDMASAIASSIEADDATLSKVELKQAGGGDPAKAGFYLNLTLKNEFIEQEIMRLVRSDSLKIVDEEKKQAERVLVDFSSPNIAKNMHVGHLRSTIQGDSICRVLEFMGYDVLRTNHLGDWGTQFGMLIAELDDKFPNIYESKVDLGDLQTFYKEARRRFDSEPEFKQRAQENVVKLQQGDPHCYKSWQFLCDLSRQEFSQIYERLRIRIEDRGESFYNPFLKPMVDELVAKGFIQESDGAKCIFIPKQKTPVMVQKRDGGFNYDTTDLAALRYRIEEQKADWIIYITDVG